MVIGIQNYTLSLFNQTHYYEFVQHRHAVFTSLGSIPGKFTFLENFNRTIAGIKFPTSKTPTEAYHAYSLLLKRNLKKSTPTQTTTLQKPEIMALLRQGVSLPSSSPQTLSHHRVSRLRTQTATNFGGVDGNLLLQGGSSARGFERGSVKLAPPSHLSRLRDQQNQEMLVLNIISCIAGLAILYSFVSILSQAIFDRRN